MPWVAVPFDDARIEQLYKAYNVQNVPTLIVLDNKKHLLKENAVGDV